MVPFVGGFVLGLVANIGQGQHVGQQLHRLPEGFIRFRIGVLGGEPALEGPNQLGQRFCACGWELAAAIGDVLGDREDGLGSIGAHQVVAMVGRFGQHAHDRPALALRLHVTPALAHGNDDLPGCVSVVFGIPLVDEGLFGEGQDALIGQVAAPPALVGGHVVGGGHVAQGVGCPHAQFGCVAGQQGQELLEEGVVLGDALPPVAQEVDRPGEYFVSAVGLQQGMDGILPHPGFPGRGDHDHEPQCGHAPFQHCRWVARDLGQQLLPVGACLFVAMFQGMEGFFV